MPDPTGFLRPLDVVALLIYLAAMAAMGVYFARRNNTTEDYFLGNRSIPGWAIGLSMLGTSISSVTFLALPAAAYILDYRSIIPNLMLPVAGVLALVFFIPLFRAGSSTSAFEYLERRFGHWIRIYAAVSFLFLQVLRLSTVLYLVAIPMSFLLNVPILVVVLVGGVLVAFYTVIGGIEAVIWTDVIQTVILLLGGLLCLGMILYQVPGGLGEIIEIGVAHDKFSVGPIEWGLGERTFLTMVLLGLVGFTTEYASNQNVVQRYHAASSMREARKATLISVLMSVPTWLLFFFLGTCLFAYYQTFPDAGVEGLEPEQVLPRFILMHVPAGIAGIIIAGCLAAAMSSLDSSINAISTISTIDVLQRYVRRGRSDEYYLKAAKLLATAAGVLMIVGAVIFHFIPRESIVDLGFILTSLFGGGILGIYMLGFFTTRVDLTSIVIGLVIALSVNLYLMVNEFGWLPEALRVDVHAYWIGILVNLVLVVVAYAAALVRRRPPTDLEGLTVWTLPADQR